MTPRRYDLDGLRAAAEALGVHESTVRRMVAAGELAVEQDADYARMWFDMDEVRALARQRTPRGPGRPRVIAEGDAGATYLRITLREIRAWDRAARAAKMTRSGWLRAVANGLALGRVKLARKWIDARAGAHVVNFKHSADAAQLWDREAEREQTTRVRWLRAVANEAAGVRS